MSLHAFATGSREGDARAPGALARILQARHLPTTFACAEQIHGSGIHVVRQLSKSHRFLGADGFLSEAEAQPLIVFTADCAPVFVSADNARVIGLLHAGWRGIQKKILPKAVRILRRKWGIPPSRIQVWTGPHIGPCCFQVHWDVAQYFPASRRRSKDRWRVNLAKELKAQAARLGVRWTSKKGFQGCTMHEARFYSYRRDKTPKRQVSVIMKRKTR